MLKEKKTHIIKFKPQSSKDKNSYHKVQSSNLKVQRIKEFKG